MKLTSIPLAIISPLYFANVLLDEVVHPYVSGNSRYL